MLSYSALTIAPNEDDAAALCEDLEALMPEPTGTGIFEIEDGSGLWEVGAVANDGVPQRPKVCERVAEVARLDVSRESVGCQTREASRGCEQPQGSESAPL